MGHWILSDELLEAGLAITHQAGMMFMSHCQDPEHAARLARASRGRRVLLTHATAAGSGSHGDAVASLEQVLALAHTSPGVTLDFTTAHLRSARGLRDGILIDARAQAIGRDAAAGGRIAACEGRGIRAAHGAGGWVSRSGLRPRVGVGDLPLFR